MSAAPTPIVGLRVAAKRLCIHDLARAAIDLQSVSLSVRTARGHHRDLVAQFDLREVRPAVPDQLAANLPPWRTFWRITRLIIAFDETGRRPHRTQIFAAAIPILAGIRLFIVALRITRRIIVVIIVVVGIDVRPALETLNVWGVWLARLAIFNTWLLVVLAWVATHVLPDWRFLRRPLASLLVAVMLSTLLVAWVKSWTNMDCPWDLVRYGGDRRLIDLFALRPLGLRRGACIPAGHASAGNAWMALYFFFASVAPRWRWAGLAVGVGLGLLFGFTQQLRGAHFLSHDIWTAALCWATALLLYLPFRRDADGRVPMRGRGVPA